MENTNIDIPAKHQNNLKDVYQSLKQLMTSHENPFKDKDYSESTDRKIIHLLLEGGNHLYIETEARIFAQLMRQGKYFEIIDEEGNALGINPLQVVFTHIPSS